MFGLLSPNLVVNNKFVRGRSSYSEKNGKTVIKPLIMEFLFNEIASCNHVHHGCFPVNVTKILKA